LGSGILETYSTKKWMKIPDLRRPCGIGVQADLDSGVLVKIRVQGLPREVLRPMRVVFRKDAPPGPAARAFMAQLKQ
jgi:hypothetical protein